MDTETGHNLLLSLHILAIITWMAGMLYLPRIFVYHAALPKGHQAHEVFKVMERRLLRIIMTPSMLVVFLSGLALAWLTFGGDMPLWLHLKLTLVFVLAALHGFMARCLRELAAKDGRRTPRFYRIVNESVTVLMVGVVLLVTFKPFS